MPVKYIPKPLLKCILALLSLLLIALPVVSYAAPIARATTSPNADDANSEGASPPSVDMHAPGVEGDATAAEMLARAESPREARALRQLGVRLQEPCPEAKAAAENDVNGTLWFLGGCLGGIIGLGAAYIIEPDPPSQALVGKSDQYVAEYTDCYKNAAGDTQQTQALYGCLASVAAYGAFYAILAATAASSTATTTTY